MTRSRGFGSTARDYAPLSDSVSLRLPYTVKLATNSKSLTHYTKGTQSLLAELLLLVRTRFQDLFHSPLRGSFRLSLTVLVHYGSVSSIFALEDGPPMFRQGFTCPALLVFTEMALSDTGLSPSMAALSRAFS